MKKLLLLLSLNLWTNFNAEAQCNFNINFYNMPNLEFMKDLVYAGNNQYYSQGFISPSGQVGHAELYRLDSVGDIIWSKSYCGYYLNDLQYSLDSNLVAVNERFYVCGPTLGYHDIVFYKFDLNGDTIFTSHFGTPGGDSNPSLVVLSDSTFIVSTDNDVGQDNLYHLDAMGQVIGTGYMPFQFILDAVQGKDGSIYYCGFLCENVNDSYIIGKTNITLDTINWIKTYGTFGGGLVDGFKALFVLPDSNIVTTGNVEGVYKINYQTGDSIWHKYSYEADKIYMLKDSTLLLLSGYYLTKLTLNGDTVWFKHLGINNQNWLMLNSVFEFNNGCIAALGSKYTFQYIYAPFFAYFDSSFNFPLNVGFDDLLKGTEAIVFPNPVTWKSTLKFANELHEAVDFTLYDVTGKIVEQQQTNDAEFIISKNNRSGLFIYELSFTNGFKQRGKVMFVD